MKNWTFILLILLGGCSDNDNPISPQPLNATDAPSISNLRTSPGKINLGDGGGSVQTIIRINFSDNNGDITTARYQDSTGEDITLPLAGFSGETLGYVDFPHTVITTTSRSITYSIWLIDNASNESNKLSGSFWVSW